MMGALLQEAVAMTRGWSASQLIALYCDLAFVTGRAKRALGVRFEAQTLKVVSSAFIVSARSSLFNVPT